MRLTSLIPAAAAVALVVGGCGSDTEPAAKPPAPSASSTAPQLPYGTYTRTVSKTDIARTAATRDEGGPNQETAPTGVYRLVIAKGASGPVLKVPIPPISRSA